MHLIWKNAPNLQPHSKEAISYKKAIDLRWVWAKGPGKAAQREDIQAGPKL